MNTAAPTRSLIAAAATSSRRAATCTAALAALFAVLPVHAQYTQPAYTPPAGRTLLRAGHVLDVHTGREAADQTVIVTGDRITAIAPTASTPMQPGDREVDLRQDTLLPGLMDVHVHLTGATDFDPYFELSMTPGKEAIIGVENARVTLLAGFTTVRNVGANDFTDVALRDEINAGHIPGPHMQVSGPPLGITGGHMDENLLPYQYHLTAEGVADGIPAVQHMVRQNIKYGADLIKIGASGGVLSKGDDPQASQYTLEEMQAIVADAHRLGRKVAAHAHGAQAILWASRGRRRLHRARQLHRRRRHRHDAPARHLPRAHQLSATTGYKTNGNLPAIYKQKMTDTTAVARANHRRAIKPAASRSRSAPTPPSTPTASTPTSSRSTSANTA